MIVKYKVKSKKGVSPAGLEPTAFGLRVRRSAIELRGHKYVPLAYSSTKWTK